MSPEERLRAAFEAHRAGRLTEAEAGYRAVLAIDPGQADALNLLGSLRRKAGHLEEGIDLLQRAVVSAPIRADIRFNLGNALAAAGAYEAAAEAYRVARLHDPANAEAAAHHGVALGKAGRGEEAIAAYEEALRLAPGHKLALHNLGNALGERGATGEGFARLVEAVEAHPDLDEARYNLSLLALRRGDYGTGFPLYAARWRTEGFGTELRHAALPEWDGRPFPGKRLVVQAEQGLGDTLQFVRLLALVKPLGGTVSLEVPHPLVALLSTVAGVDRLVGVEETAAHDLRVALLDLPAKLKLTLGSIPARVPYLAAEPARISAWRERMRPDGRPIVAVNWRGNPASPADRGRSLASAEALAPLASGGAVRLVAVTKCMTHEIEKDEGLLGHRVAGLSFRLEHPGPDFDGGPFAFLDTAAVLCLADHVVTTDTAIAHLAGALGRPTALLLKAVPDWRWLEGRADTPWYPSVRVHRQPHAGDFATPIAEVAAALSGLFRPKAAAG